MFPQQLMTAINRAWSAGPYKSSKLMALGPKYRVVVGRFYCLVYEEFDISKH